ncbi:SDR family oxidoreductase [Zavarzinia compransoris]|uniref:3-oxoacyl-ACP reductase n=1 Tax=Zavarzinia compransoris TaxID=1264899 RepID=A0A317E110_9PROT|nr:SDR family oxidoreductase [Zavarzinia compransoris]PWR20767.1 3-oxoacyl-ACP reductase [Zavarzinia compransoris]TDP44400.1 NAD(P)-dependent dehydrogenase (short-subunit alcohol dehydrogenase family) [Zavarzinia compransoris]
MSIRFDNRVAIVTGAGGGLGRSHALALAARGAKVVVNDLGGAVDGSGSSAGAAQRVVDEIKALGGEAVADTNSVSTAETAEALVKTAIDTFGKLDIVINNAGILRDKSFAKGELADFRLVLEVHLLGSVYVTKAAWPHLQANNYGRVVMTSSASGLYGNFGQANYGSAKLGLVGLMNTLKLEGQKNDIRVNTIAPVAATRMTENLLPPAVLETLKPELVTSGVLHLVQENSPNGAILEAGAGYYSLVQIVEGTGVKLGAEATAEDVAAAWDKIADMSKATPAFSSNEKLATIFA